MDRLIDRRLARPSFWSPVRPVARLPFTRRPDGLPDRPNARLPVLPADWTASPPARRPAGPPDRRPAALSPTRPSIILEGVVTAAHAPLTVIVELHRTVLICIRRMRPRGPAGTAATMNAWSRRSGWTPVNGGHLAAPAPRPTDASNRTSPVFAYVRRSPHT